MKRKEKRINTLMRYVFILFFIFYQVNATAQIEIKGFISDSLNNAIPYANVQLLDNNKNRAVKYTISNDKGNFKLELLTFGKFFLKISYIGYETILKPINVNKDSKAINLHIILQESTKQLNEVIIEGDIPDVILKKDTIVYNISEFLSGTEENLEELIKKLPGLDIDENNKILAQGKKIDKLLIDGEDFFDDQHQLVTHNIKPEMVKNIELLKNYREFSDITLSNAGGLTALNINLKKSYRHKIVGNIETAYGYNNSYYFNTGLFAFYKKFKIGFIGNVNNQGKPAISIEDYLNFQGGIQKYIKNSTGVGAQIIDEKDLPDFLLTQNNIRASQSNTPAVNFVYNPSEKFKINGFSILNYSLIEKYEITRQLFFSDPINLSGIDTNQISADFFFNTNVINTNYKPNKDILLNYTISYTPLFDNSNNNINNNTLSNTNYITQKFENNSYLLGQQLSYIQKIKKSILISVNGFFEHTNLNNYLKINSKKPFLNINFIDNFNISQIKLIEKTFYGLSTKSNFKIKKNSFEILLGINSYDNTFNSNISEYDSVDFSNNISLFNKTLHTGFNYSLKLNKKTNINVGGKYKYVFFKYNDISQTNKSYFFFNFGININPKLNTSFTLSYNQSNQFPTIEQLIPNNLIKDFRTIKNSNNIDYFNSTVFNQYQANYFSYNINSGTLFVLNLTLINKLHSIGFNSEYNSRYNILTYSYTPIDNFGNAFFLFDKDFEKKHFSVRLYSLYTYINKLNYIENIDNETVSHILKSMIKINSNFKSSVINFTFGTNYIYNNTLYRDYQLKTQLITYEPFIEINGIVENNFKWYINLSFEKYITEKHSRELTKLSPQIKYHLSKSNWTFGISGYNILNLNNQEIIEINNYPDYYQEKSISTLSGYLILSVAYNLH